MVRDDLAQAIKMGSQQRRSSCVVENLRERHLKILNDRRKYFQTHGMKNYLYLRFS